MGVVFSYEEGEVGGGVRSNTHGDGDGDGDGGFGFG